MPNNISLSAFGRAATQSPFGGLSAGVSPTSIQKTYLIKNPAFEFVAFIDIGMHPYKPFFKDETKTLIEVKDPTTGEFIQRLTVVEGIFDVDSPPSPNEATWFDVDEYRSTIYVHPDWAGKLLSVSSHFISSALSSDAWNALRMGYPGLGQLALRTQMFNTDVLALCNGQSVNKFIYPEFNQYVIISGLDSIWGRDTQGHPKTPDWNDLAIRMKTKDSGISVPVGEKTLVMNIPPIQSPHNPHAHKYGLFGNRNEGNDAGGATQVSGGYREPDTYGGVSVPNPNAPKNQWYRGAGITDADFNLVNDLFPRNAAQAMLIGLV